MFYQACVSTSGYTVNYSECLAKKCLSLSCETKKRTCKPFTLFYTFLLNWDPLIQLLLSLPSFSVSSPSNSCFSAFPSHSCLLFGARSWWLVVPSLQMAHSDHLLMTGEQRKAFPAAAAWHSFQCMHTHSHPQINMGIHI